VQLDDRVDTSFGRRAVDWELKGVPVKLEVGPRDVAAGNVVVARRDTGEKTTVPLGGAADAVAAALDDAQTSLLEGARARREAATVDVTGVDEAIEAAQTGFATVPWAALGEEGETTLAGKGITVRCLRTADGGLPAPGQNDDLLAVVGRAY
jgi:prolyl-tRNA synthetase